MNYKYKNAAYIYAICEHAKFIYSLLRCTVCIPRKLLLTYKCTTKLMVTMRGNNLCRHCCCNTPSQITPIRGKIGNMRGFSIRGRL